MVLIIMGGLFLLLAAAQLVTGRAPTEVSSLFGKTPGSFKRRAMPFHFWFMFCLNVAVGAFFVFGGMITK